MELLLLLLLLLSRSLVVLLKANGMVTGVFGQRGKVVEDLVAAARGEGAVVT